MTEIGHRMRVLAAWLVSLSMMTGFLFMLPEGAVAAPPDGIVTGNVNDGTSPLPNSLVIFMMMYSSGDIMDSTFTDVDGDYSQSLPGGVDYMLMVFNDSCYAQSASVRVLSSEITYLNITMEPIAPAVTDVTLMGWIKDELGNPITFGQFAGYTMVEGGEGMPLYLNATSVDLLGFYTVNVLPSSSGCGLVAIDVPGYPMDDNFTEGATYSGQTYWVNLTLMPESSTEDATIAGTVVDIDTGLPLQDVMVSIQTWNDTLRQGDNNYTWTDSEGKYFMNITSGWTQVMMTKPAYTFFRQEGFDISPGENLILNAALKATSATVMGNVTDAKTGLPIQSARVYVVDPSFTIMNMAFTNASGAYVLEAFNGTGLYLAAQADQYSQSMMTVDIDVGEVLWADFELSAVDAWCTGEVTDAISGDPVPDAWIHFWSPIFEDEANTDGSGAYNITLVSGDYSVDVNAPDYMGTTVSVTISPGGNVLDIQLMPNNIPETVRLWGYVNDSSAGTGIPGATIEVGTGPPDYMERNMTSSMGDGYYEMMLPPLEMMVVVYAGSHTHVETYVNCSGMIEVRQDFVLDPDFWSPNVTYSQSPLENVSWTNPSQIHAAVEELDMRQMALFFFLSNGSGSGWTYYYAVEMLYNNFNPLDSQPNNLPYWTDGYNYTVDYAWVAQPGGGWLRGSGGDLYLMYYNVWWGPDQYSALRGTYVNSSMSSPEQGTAWFSGATGQFEFFTFDNGGIPTATPDDPTGVISPYGMSMAIEDGSGMVMWRDSVPMGDWSVSGTVFSPDWTGPSGDYVAMMMFSDWANGGWGNFAQMTVDNDLPVADAGPDQQVIVTTLMTFNGTASSDNVGIVSYEWYFDDGGPVMLTGPTADYTFTALGEYTVELVVTDAAGHQMNDTMVVEVLSDAAPVAVAGPDQDVAYGVVVYFNGSLSFDDLGIANYTWSIVELSHDMYGPTPEYTFAAPGVYNVTLVVTDTTGHTSDPDGLVVTARDVTPPSADAGDDQTKMGGELVTLNGSDSFDDIDVVSWTWTFMYDGSPVVLTGEVVDFTFWIEGVYVITLNVTDAAGNYATDEVQITISGMIPEFPTMIVPVVGVLLLMLFVRARKIRK